jgi:abortive infection bacteriophage resistance protein
MQVNSYTKPHATAAQRVEHLRSKGLVISRPNVAARKIEEIGYERLRIYFLSRRDRNLLGKPFLPGTTYKDILRLYELDTEIRNVCFSAVGRFEIVFRNRISETLSARFGGHPYSEASVFKSIATRNDRFQNALQTFNSSKDRRAKHYLNNYDKPTLPPIWVLKEFLTFGASARLYHALSNNIRDEIAIHFRVVSTPVFDSWVTSFVDLRNFCAHHDRLFNRGFQKQPQRLVRSAVPSLVTDSTKLKAQLECLDFVLGNNGAKSLVSKVEKVINRYPEVQSLEVGF